MVILLLANKFYLNSDAIKFQELYYLERQHINFLDKQRCGNFITS